MFTVYLVNFGYVLTPSHNSLDDAMEHAKRAGFESEIINEKGFVVKTFSSISGFKSVSEFIIKKP